MFIDEGGLLDFIIFRIERNVQHLAQSGRAIFYSVETINISPLRGAFSDRLFRAPYFLAK